MKIQKPTIGRIVEVTLESRDLRIKRPAVIVNAFGTSLVNLKVFLDPINDGDAVKNHEGCILPPHAAETMSLTSAPYDAAGELVGSWRYPPQSKDEIELPVADVVVDVTAPAAGT